jgi:hypothetical protein
MAAERVLSVAPAQPTVSNGFMLTGGSLLKPPSVSGAPGPLTDLEALMPSATPASDEALKRRVNSLEENNAVLQHRVGQLEAAVAVLARLVEHPLVKQALDGQDEPGELLSRKRQARQCLAPPRTLSLYREIESLNRGESTKKPSLF